MTLVAQSRFLNLLRPLLNEIKVPEPNKLIVSHESSLSHENDICRDGLYVCLKCYVCFCKPFAMFHHEEKCCKLYMQIKRTSDQMKITKVAFNIDGGNSSNHLGVAFHESYAITVFPYTEDSFGLELLREHLNENEYQLLIGCAEGIRKSFVRQFGTWERKAVLKETKNHLLFDQNASKVTDSFWKTPKCEHEGCKITDLSNLWLNLHDGYIGCGQLQNDYRHSLKHYYDSNGKFPLIVRLGSLSSLGGEVYSYNEESIVSVPQLAAHLLLLGIDCSKLRCTVTPIGSLELMHNNSKGLFLSPVFALLPGYDLVPISGPFLTGLINPDNRCYMYSILQTLLGMCTRFRNEYSILDNREQFRRANRVNPSADGHTQTAKIITSLSSGQFGNKINSNMFKLAVGRDHPFTTDDAQDSRQFFQYLMDRLPITERGHFRQSFDFKLLTRSVSSVDSEIIDTEEQVNSLFLSPIGQYELKLASIDTEDESPELSIPLIDLIEEYFKAVDVKLSDDENDTIRRHLQIRTFPEILILNIELRRFPDSENDFTKVPLILQVDEVIDMTKFSSIQTGSFKYRLSAIVYHVGPTTTIGHFVTFVRINERWILFDDEHVSQIVPISSVPPVKFGFLYFYTLQTETN